MSGSRYIDLAITVCVADIERDATGRPRWRPGSDEELTRVGGRWDRRTKKWSPGRARQRLVIRFHRGQERAARWFVGWLERFVSNDWSNYKRAWSALFIGGRRSGKTHLACAAMVVFAVLNPRALLWAISPTLETGDELDTNFKELLPRGWYTRKQAKTGRSTTYRLANGSRILLKSAVKPQRLKAGRVDLCLLNEAQELQQLAYIKLRAAIADRGGIVLLTANPPDTPSGRWVEEHYLAAKAGAIEAVVFELDPRENPWINYEALASIGSEIDQKTFERDVLGLFAPIGDVVFHAWDQRESWIDPWPGLIDITAEVTLRELGRAHGDVVGQDYQRTPSMVGLPMRFFRDPKDPGEILTWVVDEAVVDDANEDELLDALESTPRWQFGDGRPDTRDRTECYRGWAKPDDLAPVHCAVIADASGFWQDGAHNDGKTSDRWLHARGWKSMYKPSKDSDRNPAISERMKAGNARLKSADGKRRLFVARHCVRTAEALRLYDMKNGFPNRKSQYAHIADAVTYPIYRFFGRPKTKGAKQEYRGLGRLTRTADLKGY